MTERIQRLGAYIPTSLQSDKFFFSKDIKDWIKAPASRPKVKRKSWYTKKYVDKKALK